MNQGPRCKQKGISITGIFRCPFSFVVARGKALNKIQSALRIVRTIPPDKHRDNTGHLAREVLRRVGRAHRYSRARDGSTQSSRWNREP